MQYRAFVASTRLDLQKQRDHVAAQLESAGLYVERQEKFSQADPTHPAELSARAVARCHFCIALIAFRRGHPSTLDAGKSITQVEIQTARARGVRVLPFLLEDTSENRDRWPAEFNELDWDPGVRAWRQEYREVVVGFFQHDQMPDVLPAVTRQITAWEQQRRKRLRRVLGGVVAGVVAVLLLFALSTGARGWLLSRLHAYHDPVAFSHSRDGSYQVARLIDGRADLRDNTNFREEIRSSKTSFRMFANTFLSFIDYETVFEEIAARGVSVQIILTDFSESNRPNWQGFLDAIEGAKTEQAPEWVNANTYRSISRLAGRYPGQVELRLNSMPMLYTMWIRDASEPDGLGHLGVNMYSNVTDWPCYRVTRITGGNQLGVMNGQFDKIWAKARKYEGPVR